MFQRRKDEGLSEEVENFDESTFVSLAPPVWVDRDISWRLTLISSGNICR